MSEAAARDVIETVLERSLGEVGVEVRSNGFAPGPAKPPQPEVSGTEAH